VYDVVVNSHDVRNALFCRQFFSIKRTVATKLNDPVINRLRDTNISTSVSIAKNMPQNQRSYLPIYINFWRISDIGSRQ